MTRPRIRAEVRGIVQGVGFRPFVYSLARSLALGGLVRNTSFGALLEVEGPVESLDRFFSDLEAKAPPLAWITRVDRVEIPTLDQAEFVITHSEAQADRTALISPDVAVCDDCLRELLDPSDRRFRYPFINCTNCGPRYTIIADLPYDRDKTSMRVFPMCPDCRREYEDPVDRRFHAQPNACPACGPRVYLTDDRGLVLEEADPIRSAAGLLGAGKIVAVKGLGGFHLAVDACDEAAVRRLRARKRREEKPLAVMSPDLHRICSYALVPPDEARTLAAIQRPITLLEKKQPFPLAEAVAPDNKLIGAMLPYTPLHHLLLAGFTALVMTSGNLAEEPIARDNREALDRLSGIADFFLMHDRDILARADDSVVRVRRGRASQIRRSRGFAPAPVFLPENLPSVLAAGGEMKNTVCLTKDDRAFVSQHIGDLENLITLDLFERTIENLKRLLDATPLALAHDLHPDYLSTKWAEDQTGLELIGVQHHHAHIAGVMAENHLPGPVLGVSCDGAGLGTDGCIWGGETLLVRYENFERLGHLDYVAMPGGAAAIREPWRMAVAYLEEAFGGEIDHLDLDFLSRRPVEQLGLLRQVIKKKIKSPLTSSLGRLFDAVAALAGLRDRVGFEGQAALMLEMRRPAGEFEPYPFDLEEKNGLTIIKHQPLVRAVVRDVGAGLAVEEISGRFHAGVSRIFHEAVLRAVRKTGLKTVCLSGGCFQNRVLSEGLMTALESSGLKVYTGYQVPVNDGGLSLGQAACAAKIMAKRK
ncbi:MAG: carbamoyltransferase HypF [Pseudomonadota bacterium]